MSKVTAPNPPADDMRAGMARVWGVYSGAFDEIQSAIRERLASHGAFGPLVRDLPGGIELAEAQLHAA